LKDDVFGWNDKLSYYKERDKWTEDSSLKWRTKGLQLAKENMKMLCELCRDMGIGVTIAVYPWPKQVLTGKMNSLHTVIWCEFARERGIDFMDFFPDFINSGVPAEVIDKYFIKGDPPSTAVGKHD